jgi:hypothetical protein
LARPETGRHFWPSLANSGRQRPRFPASRAAKPRKVKEQPNDYGRWMTRCVKCAASVCEPQHLLLTRPCDRCIEKAGDTDSARCSSAEAGIVLRPSRDPVRKGWICVRRGHRRPRKRSALLHQGSCRLEDHRVRRQLGPFPRSSGRGQCSRRLSVRRRGAGRVSRDPPSRAGPAAAQC